MCRLSHVVSVCALLGSGLNSIASPSSTPDALSLLQLDAAASTGGRRVLRVADVDDVDVASTRFRLPSLGLKSQRWPWEDAAEPLSSCRSSHEETVSSASWHLAEAVRTYCSAGLGELTELFVDARFATVHDKLVDEDGWLGEAFVTYVGFDPMHDKASRLAEEADLLLQSIHEFSTRPVVVANFGPALPLEWTPERFPRMILLHGQPMPAGKSFNYNKIRAMIFSKVKAGIVLDADQWINRGMDSMFQRAKEEGGDAYPYPILPVHWMSRDPESSDFHMYTFKFASSDAPRRSMRWAHAHPTWTYEASQFLARWSSYILAPAQAGAPLWLRRQSMMEDEGLFNVALWAENRTKQWCKFDIPSPSLFQMRDDQRGGVPQYQDTKWFPRGIPLMFFSAHDAKDPAVSYKLLSKLGRGQDGKSARVIFYDGRWFANATELQSYDPDLRCLA